MRVEGSFGNTLKPLFDEIKETNITEEERKNLCDLCILEFHEIYKIAFYVCFTCSKYLCIDCFINHNSYHNFVSRESDQSEVDSMIDEMGNESGIVETSETEKVCVCDRVSVTHEFDEEECSITGLCGLDKRMWVACDYSNSCIKVFQYGSNILLRYLKIGSQPEDVTEVQVKLDSTVSDSASRSSSDTSGTSLAKPDKQCLLAVTSPEKRHISFIDLHKHPAVRVKIITMKKKCYGIEYSDDKVFTVCEESFDEDGSNYSVHVMSTNGDQLSIIQTGIYSGYNPDLAVFPGRVYLTDCYKDKVKCINFESKVLSKIKMVGLWPLGISVDQENVYVSTLSYPEHNVYTLDLDLAGTPRPLLDPSIGYLQKPQALCLYRNQLFVSHKLSNIVSLVRLF